MNNASGIYAILHLSTGRHYVGSAVQLKRRFDRHRSDLMAQRHHNQKLQRAWNKHGADDFRFDTLEQCPIDLLIEREQFWLDNTSPYFNVLRHARSGAGYTHSDEAKKRMSEKSRAAWRAMSEEDRQARARAHGEKIRGRTATAETREKMRLAKLGRDSTPEQKLSFERNKNNPEAVAKRVALKAKSYIVTDPSGVELRIKNLSAFCREHNLLQGHMNAIARGKRTVHKGWRCRYDGTD